MVDELVVRVLALRWVGAVVRPEPVVVRDEKVLRWDVKARAGAPSVVLGGVLRLVLVGMGTNGRLWRGLAKGRAARKVPAFTKF